MKLFDKIKTPTPSRKKNISKKINKILKESKEVAIKNLSKAETPEGKLSSPNPFHQVIKGRVLCDRLAVRYEPSENSYLKRIETKNTIIYLEECGSASFFKVFNEYDAYLSKKYIKVLDV